MAEKEIPMGLHPGDELFERRSSPTWTLTRSVLVVLGVLLLGFLALVALYQMAGR